jgi:hypothetical protein
MKNGAGFAAESRMSWRWRLNWVTKKGAAKSAPHVRHFAYELVSLGRGGNKFALLGS